MSWNISLKVDEHGKVTVDEEASYTNTAPRNSVIGVSGHVVNDGEQGFETVSASVRQGDKIVLQTSAGRTV